MSAGRDQALDLEDLLNPDEQRRFRRLCIETSTDELGELGAVIELHLEQVAANAGPATDVDTARLIGRSLRELLDSGADFDADQRAQIRGAIEYFVMTDDASSDLDDVLGFDDDARVLNAMLSRIGHPTYAVELPG
ncbi:MAG: hypothetical protein AAGA93_10120 [Actinomycetota bacterium]